MSDIECFMVRAVAAPVRVGEETAWAIVREDTGAVVAEDVPYLGHQSTPAGAMWWSEGYHVGYFPTGPDDWTGVDEEYRPTDRPRTPSHLFGPGPHLVVMTPGGVWNIDSRANNCALPYDYEHRCWVRHGEPPAITVDKDGPTCAAGAGSIQCGDYHGFLRGGRLVT